MSSEPKYRGKLPFDIVESDVDTGYNKQVVSSTLQDIEIVNIHTDEYGHLENSPLQGPFTEKWVGGHQHRHIALNTGTDNEQNRPEAFLIDLSPNKVKIVGPTHFDPLRPRAIYSRDNIAKSPLNIKNIKSDAQNIGNFSKNYEIVQTSGRNINQSLIQNNATASGVLTTKFINFISSSEEYALPNYTGSGKTIIIERFSAPGDKKESSRGALDRNGEEYSPNNSLITRNITVRQKLYPQLTAHAAQFTSGFHGVNRNGLKKVKYVFVLSTQYNQPLLAQNNNYLMLWHITSSLYDNFWVQHAIPATDLRYKWIADANTNKDFASLLQYQSFAGTYNKNSAFSDITFNSSSFVISGSNKQFEVDNNYINSIVKDKKQVNINTNTFSITSPELSSSFSEIVNTAFGFSTWKQLRNNEHPVVRALNKNNIFSIEGDKTIIVNNATLISRRSNTLLNLVETPVTSKFKPIEEVLKLKGSEQNYTFTFTHQNNKSTFTNKLITNKLGLNENSQQMYDMFLKYYTDPNITTNPQNPFSSFQRLSYTETVYPREINTYLAETRGRTAYILTQSGSTRDGYDGQLGTQRVFWRDKLENRKRGLTGFRNSMNYLITPDLNYDVYNPQYNKTGIGEEYEDFNNGSDSRDINYTSSLTLLNNYRQESISAFDNNLNNDYRELWNYASHIYSGSALIDAYIVGKTIDNGCSGELNSEIFIDYYYSSSATDVPAYPSQLLRVTPFVNYLQFDYKFERIDFFNFNYTGSYYSYSNFIIKPSSLPFNPFLPSVILYPIYNPRPHFTAFLGGFESGSRDYGLQPGFSAKDDGFKTPENYNFFTNQPTGIVSSTLDSGLRYDEASYGDKKAWFDSYEHYLTDIKGLAKDYSIIPEFNISENIPYYVSENAGNFRAKNNTFVKLDGANKDNYSSSQLNLLTNRQFAESYYLSDNCNVAEQIQKDNINAAVDYIKFKVSGIKKLLPYNGFYPKERTLQLANLFNNFLDNNVDGGWFKSTSYIDGPDQAYFFSINSEDNRFGILRKYFYKNAVIPYFFAPGILYNTIKSGISVDFPAITGSFDALLSPINLANEDYKISSITTNFTINNTTINLSHLKDDLINTRIPFEALIFPESYIPLNSDLEDGESIVFSGSSQEATRDVFNKYLSNSLFNIKFDAFANPETFLHPSSGPNRASIGLGYKNSVPFAYLKTDKVVDPSYSMAMSNFLAEIPKFFLKKHEDEQHLNVFRSSTLKNWKRFDPKKEYYFDLRLKKSSDLIMIESYSGSYRVTGSRDLEKTANGRYFGWPVNKLTASIDNGSIAEQFSVHNDPAYAPFTPPYFEGEAVLRFKLPTGSATSYTSVGALQDNIILEDIFIGLSGSVSQESQAYKHKMSLRSCLDLFGVGSNKEVTYDQTGQPLQVSDSQDPGNEYWTISPYLETPVLDFSSQSFQSKTGSYWVSDGYGRGMWSGYGVIPTNSKGITLKLADSYPLADNTLTGSLLTQIGFTPEQKRIGQIADNKEISEAIVAIPYVLTEIQDTTVKIDNFNFFKVNLDSYLMQRLNLQQGLPAVTAGQNNGTEIRETSISKLITAMNNYIIPPNFNFLKYADIHPFVMYIFEFKHILDQQDLADIWQSVMPKISLNAEQETIEFGHKLSKYELLEQDFKIPQNMRWMIFKIKKKAEANYFAITANQKDDSRFQFYFANNQSKKTPEYSYNWPYDYFSLVELAKVDISYTFVKKEETIMEQEEIEQSNINQFNNIANNIGRINVEPPNLVTNKPPRTTLKK